MIIEQKAREIVASILRQIDFQKRAKETEEGAWDATAPVIAARLGIIEGLEMAARVAEQWNENSPYNSRAAAIRALIEEQKP